MYTYKGKNFDQLHEEYANRYGLRWLQVNQAMSRVAEQVGIDPSTQSMKLLLTAAAAATLDSNSMTNTDPLETIMRDMQQMINKQAEAAGYAYELLNSILNGTIKVSNASGRTAIRKAMARLNND